MRYRSSGLGRVLIGCFPHSKQNHEAGNAVSCYNMQFDPVLKGLQRVTQAPVRYFTQIEHLGVDPAGQEFVDNLIICLGEHGFFIVNRTMDKLRGEVAYTHIEKISEQKDKKRDPNVIQLELSPNRSPSIPARVTFVTSSKEVFMKHLRCYWQTDYMWRLNKVATLKIMKENIPTKRKAVSAASMPLVIEPRKNFKREPFMGYYFFLSHIFTSHKLQDEWQGKIEDAEVTLSIEVSDLQPAESMKTDLRNKAEAKAVILADGGPFWYIVNQIHIKKCNLSGDMASWRGWLVNTRSQMERDGRTVSKEIAVLIMRRKYIPPLMDTGQDITITLISDQIQTNLVPIIADLGDSFHTFPDNNAPHTEVIERKMQSLLLDEEGYRYYTTHLGFKLSYMTQIQTLIYSLLKILNRNNTDDSLKALDKKIRDQFPTIAPVEDVMEIIKAIEDEVGSSQPLAKRSWQQKLARYLAYCLDGGIYYGQFTISTIISPIVTGQIRDRKDINQLRRLAGFLLHLRKVNQNYEYHELSNQLKDMKFQDELNSQVEDDYFNEKVMIIMLEEEFIQRELEMSGDFDKMEPLLTYFLGSRSSSIDLKCAACRYVIGVYASKADNISLKFVLPQLMECIKSNSAKLATLASTAIVNMTRSNEQVKRELLTEENFLDILRTQLTTPNQSLLINLLRAFSNMTTNSTYRKFIGEHLLENFVKIIKGTGIEGAEYTDEVLGPTIAILTILARDTESKEKLVFEFNIIVELDKLMDRGEDVQSKVMIFMQKMSNRGIELKTQIANLMLEKLIDRLSKADQIRTGDFVKQLLTLLAMVTTMHDGNVAKFRLYDGVAKLDSFIQTKWATDQAARVPLEKLNANVKPSVVKD